MLTRKFKLLTNVYDITWVRASTGVLFDENHQPTFILKLFLLDTFLSKTTEL